MRVHASNRSSWTKLLASRANPSAVGGVGAPRASSGRTDPTRAHALNERSGPIRICCRNAKGGSERSAAEITVVLLDRRERKTSRPEPRNEAEQKEKAEVGVGAISSLRSRPNAPAPSIRCEAAKPPQCTYSFNPLRSCEATYTHPRLQPVAKLRSNLFWSHLHHSSKSMAASAAGAVGARSRV